MTDTGFPSQSFGVPVTVNFPVVGSYSSAGPGSFALPTIKTWPFARTVAAVAFRFTFVDPVSVKTPCVSVGLGLGVGVAVELSVGVGVAARLAVGVGVAETTGVPLEDGGALGATAVEQPAITNRSSAAPRACRRRRHATGRTRLS